MVHPTSESVHPQWSTLLSSSTYRRVVYMRFRLLSPPPPPPPFSAPRRRVTAHHPSHTAKAQQQQQEKARPQAQRQSIAASLMYVLGHNNYEHGPIGQNLVGHNRVYSETHTAQHKMKKKNTSTSTAPINRCCVINVLLAQQLRACPHRHEALAGYNGTPPDRDRCENTPLQHKTPTGIICNKNQAQLLYVLLCVLFFSRHQRPHHRVFLPSLCCRLFFGQN